MGKEIQNQVHIIPGIPFCIASDKYSIVLKEWDCLFNFSKWSYIYGLCVFVFKVLYTLFFLLNFKHNKLKNDTTAEQKNANWLNHYHNVNMQMSIFKTNCDINWITWNIICIHHL